MSKDEVITPTSPGNAAPTERLWRGGCALSLPVPLSSSDQKLVLSQHILFFALRKVCSLLCRILPLSKAQPGKQGLLGSSVEWHRGKGTEGWLQWDVCTCGVQRLYSKCMLLSRGTESEDPRPARLGSAAALATPSPVLHHQHPSSSQELNVLEHLIKGLLGGCLGVLEGDLDAAVEAEGFQLQPDEAEAVVVEQDEHPWRPLGAGEAVASNEACPIKTARG